MPDAVSVIRAVVDDRLRGFRTAELAIVTKVHAHEQASDKNNYECDVRLRDSALELAYVPVCTPRIGAVAIPNEDDLVLVQFLQGDVHRPMITGRLYNDADRPPTAKAREAVYECRDDAEDGVRRLFLKLPKDNSLLIEDGKLVVAMGKTKLTLNNDGDLLIESNAKLTITSRGDASIESKGGLSLKATGDVTVEGNTVALKARTTATLEGQASMTVKGAAVKVAGMVEFSAS